MDSSSKKAFMVGDGSFLTVGALCLILGLVFAIQPLWIAGIAVLGLAALPLLVGLVIHAITSIGSTAAKAGVGAAKAVGKSLSKQKSHEETPEETKEPSTYNTVAATEVSETKWQDMYYAHKYKQDFYPPTLRL